MRLLKLTMLAMLFAPFGVGAPAAAGNEAKDGDRMVCKYSLQTGTRFKTKTCKTAAEWEAMAEEHRNGLKDMVDRPQIKVCGPNGCD